MKIMVPIANGFEEIEATTIIDVLRRGGIKVDVVGVVGSVIEGMNGIRVMTDTTINKINAEEYDAIVIPGGSGYENLMRSAKLSEILRDFNQKEKVIGAICAAPLILANLGLLDDKRATVYPGLERKLSRPRDDKVVIDGNIITSQAPGTAMEFALKVVEKLSGKDNALKLRKQLVV